MNKSFTQLIENGTIISGTLAILVVGGAVFLTATGQAVPDWLIVTVSVVIGAYFTKSTEPKQFRSDDAERIKRALYETLPPHTKLSQLNEEFRREQKKEK